LVPKNYKLQSCERGKMTINNFVYTKITYKHDIRDVCDDCSYIRLYTINYTLNTNVEIYINHT